MKVLEKPVIKWIDGGNSKVKFSYFFKMWVDFYKIYQQYFMYANVHSHQEKDDA